MATHGGDVAVSGWGHDDRGDPLLPALLKNSERRAENAIQRKLDAVAAALLEEREGMAGEAAEALRRSIWMDEDVGSPRVAADQLVSQRGGSM